MLAKAVSARAFLRRARLKNVKSPENSYWTEKYDKKSTAK